MTYNLGEIDVRIKRILRGASDQTDALRDIELALEELCGITVIAKPKVTFRRQPGEETRKAVFALRRGNESAIHFRPEIIVKTDVRPPSSGEEPSSA